MADYTIEEVDEEIAEMEKYAEETDRRNYHKDVYSNSARREVRRLENLKELIKCGVTVEDYGPGLVLLNNKFVFSLSSLKWRVVGKNKWYRCKRDFSTIKTALGI